MLLKYGTYSFADQEPQIDIQLDSILNEAEESVTRRHTWTINGTLHGASQTALKTALDSLNSAFASDYKDLILYQDDNATVAHQLLNAGSETGVRVVRPPSFPQMTGATWSTFLNYMIVVQAEYAFNTAALSQLLSWTESVSISGGGARREIVELQTGDAQLQTVRAKTPYRATQQGSALGKFRYPVVPPPIWPAFQLEPVQVSRTAPQRRGLKYTGWGVQWSYSFASPSPLVGLPTVWV